MLIADGIAEFLILVFLQERVVNEKKTKGINMAPIQTFPVRNIKVFM